MGAQGTKERVSDRKLAACRANGRRPRPGRRKYNDEGQRNIVAALKVINETLAECVELAQKIIRNDPELGGVPLHMRMEMAKDFMDRGQMPRRTEARVEQQTAISWDDYPFAEDFRLPRADDAVSVALADTVVVNAEGPNGAG